MKHIGNVRLPGTSPRVATNRRIVEEVPTNDWVFVLLSSSNIGEV
jgi:hypothetical protein